MNDRSSELRRRTRVVFGLSMVAAAAVHALILFGSPSFQVELPEPRETQLAPPPAPEENPQQWQFVDVRFGPPRVMLEDGGTWQEPPDRTLEARMLDLTQLSLSEECAGRPRESLVPAEARVGLVLNREGRVIRAAVARGSGDDCSDAMILSIARSVVYHWIPNQEFPAPVELDQPIEVVAAEW